MRRVLENYKPFTDFIIEENGENDNLKQILDLFVNESLTKLNEFWINSFIFKLVPQKAVSPKFKFDDKVDYDSDIRFNKYLKGILRNKKTNFGGTVRYSRFFEEYCNCCEYM